MVRKDHLFYSQVQCEKEIIPMAKGLMSTGHFVKAKCFEFNPYGEEV